MLGVECVTCILEPYIPEDARIVIIIVSTVWSIPDLGHSALGTEVGMSLAADMKTAPCAFRLFLRCHYDRILRCSLRINLRSLLDKDIDDLSVIPCHETGAFPDSQGCRSLHLETSGKIIGLVCLEDKILCDYS